MKLCLVTCKSRVRRRPWVTEGIYVVAPSPNAAEALALSKIEKDWNQEAYAEKIDVLACEDTDVPAKLAVYRRST